MDNNFPSVRKNLNILSVLILILAFSNAEINRINFLGIDLELEGEKLFIGIFAIYGYFIWRFFTKLPYQSKFIGDYRQFLFEEKDGLRKQFPMERLTPEYAEQSKEFKELSESSGPLSFRPTIGREAGSIRTFTFNLRFSALDRSMHIVHLKKKVSIIYVLRKFLWFCVKYDKFGDYLFPLLPIIGNLLFFFFNKEWQGGFYQLVLN